MGNDGLENNRLYKVFCDAFLRFNYDCNLLATFVSLNITVSRTVDFSDTLKSNFFSM